MSALCFTFDLPAIANWPKGVGTACEAGGRPNPQDDLDNIFLIRYRSSLFFDKDGLYDRMFGVSCAHLFFWATLVSKGGSVSLHRSVRHLDIHVLDHCTEVPRTKNVYSFQLIECKNVPTYFKGCICNLPVV